MKGLAKLGLNLIKSIKPMDIHLQKARKNFNNVELDAFVAADKFPNSAVIIDPTHQFSLAGRMDGLPDQ